MSAIVDSNLVVLYLEAVVVVKLVGDQECGELPGGLISRPPPPPPPPLPLPPRRCYAMLRRLLTTHTNPWPLSRQFTSSSSPSHSSTAITPFTRRLFKLPSPPSPIHHHDLPSFLTYAQRTALPEPSTVYQGTHYEYTVQQALRASAFSLHRVGGRDDAGVDLVGTWHLPAREHPLRVFVQCKALKGKAAPSLVRELEGSFRVPGAAFAGGVEKAGVLVSTREATKGVRDALARSAYPVLWMMVARDGSVQQVLWNARVEELGVGRLGVEVRYHSGARASGNGNGTTRDKEIVLTWDDEEIPDMDSVERDLAALEARWLALWGGSLSERDKSALLDVVEELFPGEKPLFTTAGATGSCSTLSEADRKRVLQLLKDRLGS